MNKLRFIVFAILFFSSKLYAENYVNNISGISNLAESTVKAAALQMDTDTNKVLENLNNELQNLSSSNDNIEIALETSISEAKNWGTPGSVTCLARR